MFDITVDAKQWTDHLSDVQKEQVPFAMAKALTAVTKEFQGFQLNAMREEFTVRQEQWFNRAVKITHFATKRELFTTVGIHPPGGDARADILAKFEDETEKTPISGRHIAIPTGVKRNKRDIVQKAYRPSNLNFHQQGGRIVGDKRTFIIELPNGAGLILQRVGKGKNSTTRSLYLLLPIVPIKPELHFERNVLKIVQLTWEMQFDRAFIEAMRTAK